MVSLYSARSRQPLRAAGISEGNGYGYLFKLLIVSALIIAAGLFLVAPRIKRMMANPKVSAPADRSEKAEPDPLPAARTVED